MLNKLLGIVPNASEHGLAVEHMLEICHWFMLALFVGWATFFLVSIYKFRKSKHPKANYHGVTNHYSSHAEFTVVLIEAVLLLGLAFPLWGKRVLDLPPDQPEVMRVRAVARQFAWDFHYPGPNGKFGRIKTVTDYKSGQTQIVRPLALETTGEDAADGADDIISTNELHVVLNKPVVIEVMSLDVIHALAIPHMRIAQDAIPGTKVPMWFRPIRSGKFEIVCGQLCGDGHFAMVSHLTVEKQEEFDAFYKELNETQHPAAPAAPAK